MIRLEKEESAAWRLAPWLRSLVPTCASPPKTTANDHFSFSIYGDLNLHSGMKLLQQSDLTGSFAIPHTELFLKKKKKKKEKKKNSLFLFANA